MNSKAGPISLRGSFHLALGRLAAQVILIVTAILVPNFLGAEDYGRLVSALALVTILEVVSSGGLQVVELRHVAPALMAGRLRHAVRAAATIWWTRFALSVLAAIAFIAIAVAYQDEATGLGIAVSLGLYLLARAIGEASRHLLLSARRTTEVARLDAARSSVVLASALLFYRSGGLSLVIVGMAVGQILVSTGAVILQRRAIETPLSRFDATFLRANTGLAGLAWVGVVAWIAQSQTAVIVIGRRVTFVEAAILGVAVQAFMAMQTMIIFARSAGLPDVSKRHDESDHRSVSEWVGRSSIVALFLASAVAGLWLVVGQTVVGLLPSDMAPAFPVIVLMIAAVAPLAVALVIDGMLNAIGAPGLATTSRVVFGLVTIAPLLLFGSEMDAVSVGQLYVLASLTFCALNLVFMKARVSAFPYAKTAFAVGAPALATIPFASSALHVLLGVGLLAVHGSVGAYIWFHHRMPRMSVQ